MNDYKKLDELKQRLDKLRPLSPNLLKNLHENLILKWIYNSNAIEGNTLTIKETKVVLEGITVGGKTLVEHFEAINHKEAILYIEDIVQKKENFSLGQIKQIHHLLLKNIDNENAGVWRKNNVKISGAKHKPPEFLQVPEKMEQLEKDYYYKLKKLHPLETAAKLHCDFVKIHPFLDGNGRTARLLMNLELLKADFPAIALPVSIRLKYYEYLDEAHTRNNYKPFFSLIADLTIESFEPYWFA